MIVTQKNPPAISPKQSAFTPQRGRPTAEQATAITSSILTSARELFLQIGIDTTSMEAIAKGAGIPRSTLYKRFPEKKLLVEAVIEERIHHWGVANGERRPSSHDQSLEGQLKAPLQSLFRWFADEEVRAFTRLAMGPGENATLVSKTLGRMGYTSVIDTLTNNIEQYAQANAKTFSDPRSVAIALLSMLTGWIATQPVDQPIPQEVAEEFVDRSIELIINGFARW